MNGAQPWVADEISALCRLLCIPQEQIGYYFFPEVEPKNETGVIA